MTARDILITELAIVVVLGGLFLIFYGLPSRSREPQMAWHLASFAAAGVGEAVTQLLLIVGVAVPAWIVLTVFGVIDVIWAWRLGLLLRPPLPPERRDDDVVDSE